LTNVICKSDTIFEPANALESKVVTALFDRCNFEHPDLDFDKRIPIENLRLNWQYSSKLFKFEQLRELCLAQSSYQHNLEAFGLDLMSLEELCINHNGDEDLGILACLNYLPECVTLNFFEIYETEESPHKTYSVSDLIEAWVPHKSKATQIELDAFYEIDIVSKIVMRNVEIVSTKGHVSDEL